MSLQDILNKIKPRPQTEIVEFNENGEIESFSLLRKLFLSVTIILVATLSFGIGRLSVMGKREPVRIEYDPEIPNQTSTINLQTNQTASVINVVKKDGVVASKNGVRYHYLHCSGAKQIKEENKIFFDTSTAAEAAGFTLASNCSLKP